ncbi:serine aminopeptidase domain-containing protein [Bradyrhizobium sp. 44]|jgi:pimeloyl-ACP methyl ester carboxylesterase|uniref:serine aminopeptidase domain-containing protein n=2 Tax=unclassified Bradyrhizobium TaxID=2631580 RepID=UPI0006847CB9|nr:alpha/beta hydrolase [Bradyrhizobium sp. 44]
MLPFFFGSKQRRLFGAYEPAVRSAGAGAVLLCGSWGMEYTNAHRAMRILARRLCAAGFDTLRFDYFGAGDSGGETVDAELGGWKNDILTALGELKELSGRARIVIVGMRLGATLAVELAPRLPADVESIVLWEPIISGSQYVKELRDWRSGHHMRAFDLTMSGASDAAASELGGLLVSSSFVHGLNSIDLLSQEIPPAPRVLTIFSETHNPGFNIRSTSNNSETVTLKASSPWKDSAEQEEGLPVEIFERITEWLR